MKNKTIKKIIEISIVILSAISGFLGGQAAAENDVINLFNNPQIERKL